MKTLLASALAWLLVGGPVLHAATTAPPRAGQSRGVILQIDLPAKRLTVETTRGPQTFAVTGATRVFRDKEKIGLDQLKPGESIAFSWYRAADGQPTISRIKFTLPPEEPDQP